MILYQKNFNKPEELNAKRIISLVPSLTELLYDLGLDLEVVGLTKFCVHPQHWRKEKQIVGGTKNYRLNEIHKLAPDLIIANKEENTKEQIEELSDDYLVYLSDIHSLQDAYQCILQVGELVNRSSDALALIKQIKQKFKSLNQDPVLKSPKIAYCIWKRPYMWAGTNTFIHTILSAAGFKNAVQEERYPELGLDEIMLLKPDFIFLSSEPFPFKEKDQNHIKNLTNTKTCLVDGELFSWYGSRLLYTADYLLSLRADFDAC